MGPGLFHAMNHRVSSKKLALVSAAETGIARPLSAGFEACGPDPFSDPGSFIALVIKLLPAKVLCQY